MLVCMWPVKEDRADFMSFIPHERQNSEMVSHLSVFIELGELVSDPLCSV